MDSKQIGLFLMQFKEMLFEEHATTLKYLKSTLEYLQNTELIHSKYGFHYKLCAWRDDDASEGPDT